MTGLFDPNINPPSRNVVKDASVYGKQQQHWDGVDLTVDAGCATDSSCRAA